jgi:hypothetical protein
VTGPAPDFDDFCDVDGTDHALRKRTKRIHSTVFTIEECQNR